MQASLETIRAAANDLINEMEVHLLELQQERQAQQEHAAPEQASDISEPRQEPQAWNGIDGLLK